MQHPSVRDFKRKNRHSHSKINTKRYHVQEVKAIALSRKKHAKTQNKIDMKGLSEYDNGNKMQARTILFCCAQGGFGARR